MRLTSALVASLLFATPVFAAQEPAPQAQAEQREHKKGRGLHKMMRKLGHLDRKLDRAVADGRITQAQADQLKAEGRQLGEKLRAEREAAGGQLSDAKKQEMREQLRAFRAKVKATLKDKAEL